MEFPVKLHGRDVHVIVVYYTTESGGEVTEDLVGSESWRLG